MRAAITALSWELVARYRWLYMAAAAWLLVVSVLGLLLSAGGCHQLVGVSLVMSLSGPLMFVLGGLAHGWDTHLENAGSCFPARLFTLPVTVGWLVGPPLLLGTAVIVTSWLLAAVCMLRPFGMENVPLWWPALCGAAVLAWIQALSWFPFPLPWVRLGCVGAFLLVVFYSTLLLVHNEINEALMVGLFLTLLLLAYALALTGVSQARRGTGTREPFQLGAVVVQPDLPAPPPFSSPLRAQLWLDWKVHGWVFLFVPALWVMVALPNMYFTEMVLKQRVSHEFPWLEQARAAVGDSWLLMGYMLLGPLMIAACGGPEMGKAGLRLTDHVCPPFLATRPMSAPDMIKSKLIVSAAGVVGTWMLLLATAFCWAAWMGRIGEMSDRLIALTGSEWAAVGALVGGQVALMALAWLWLVSGLWLGALGRPLVTGVAVAFTVFGLIGVAWLLAGWPEGGWPLLDGAIVVCVVGKIVAGYCVGRQLLRERMVRTLTLSLMAAGWVLFAVVVITFEFLIIPDAARWAGITLVMLPLASPLAAPLALARNRTR
jgi:hypothetical protein